MQKHRGLLRREPDGSELLVKTGLELTRRLREQRAGGQGSGDGAGGFRHRAPNCCRDS